MQNSAPAVAIVMPNWNGKPHTLECLNSIMYLDYPKECLEIIVSDNGSTDGSQEAIQSLFCEMGQQGFRRLALVENGRNIGAPAAYNRAIQAASPDFEYVLKIDNDIVLAPEALRKMVERAESEPGLGLVGGCEFRDAAMQRVYTIGGFFINPLFRPEYPLSQQPLTEAHNVSIEVEIPTGAMMLIKHEVINRIGLFDEVFFVYWDDFDYAYRAQQAGYRARYEPGARYWHKVSKATGGSTSPLFVFHLTRSRLLFVRKHAPVAQRLLYYAYFLAASAVATLKYLCKWQPQLVVARWQGVFHGMLDSLRSDSRQWSSFR